MASKRQRQNLNLYSQALRFVLVESLGTQVHLSFWVKQESLEKLVTVTPEG